MLITNHDEYRKLEPDEIIEEGDYWAASSKELNPISYYETLYTKEEGITVRQANGHRSATVHPYWVYYRKIPNKPRLDNLERRLDPDL